MTIYNDPARAPRFAPPRVRIRGILVYAANASRLMLDVVAELVSGKATEHGDTWSFEQSSKVER